MSPLRPESYRRQPRHGGLSPSAWGKRRPRRREPLPLAAPEPFAWRAGRIAGWGFRWGCWRRPAGCWCKNATRRVFARALCRPRLPRRVRPPRRAAPAGAAPVPAAPLHPSAQGAPPPRPPAALRWAPTVGAGGARAPAAPQPPWRRSAPPPPPAGARQGAGARPLPAGRRAHRAGAVQRTPWRGPQSQSPMTAVSKSAAAPRVRSGGSATRHLRSSASCFSVGGCWRQAAAGSTSTPACWRRA